MASQERQWNTVADELRDIRKRFGAGAPGGARRTGFAEAAQVEDVPPEALIEREPITVVCSKMGWIRAMKGHIALDQQLKFKDGDEGRFFFHAETTDKLLLLGSNGRVYTLRAGELPGGRGMGEPVRLIVDLPNEAEIVTLLIHQPGAKWLLASSAGDGFVATSDDLLAQTRSGKQALNVTGDARALLCKPVTGDHVVVIGENRKMLVFPLDELPEMGRGKGVRLQKYKDGGLSDAITFVLADGLRWVTEKGQNRHVPDLAEWLGKRSGTGRMAPRGFPHSNRFPD
jgi:topoisomerase-4 subunit A